MTTPPQDQVPPPAHPPGRLLVILSVLAGGAACLVVALVVLALVLLSRAGNQDGGPPTVQAAADTPAATQLAEVPATVAPTLPGAFVITASPSPTETPAPTATEAAPATLSPTSAEAAQVEEANGCPHPADWEAWQVEPGDTLFAYVLGALNVGITITTDDVRTNNCLTSDLLQVGRVLYLPPGAGENAPSSEPAGVSAAVAAASGPRAPNCDPACTITFRPGLRLEQIAAAVDAVPVGFWGADFIAAVGPGAAVAGYDFLASRPPGNSLEGFLFPGSYQLSNATTAADFRDMLLAAFAANLPGDASAAASRGLTLYQAITLASIIQREAYAPSEQVLISSVFHNRLSSGMQLGATVTLQYAFGTPADWWPRVQGSQFSTASPYNTNVNADLPPSPIDNPGVDAIRAALYPPDTNYLFFTGNCQGSGNLYAATYDEHLANVNACN